MKRPQDGQSRHEARPPADAEQHEAETRRLLARLAEPGMSVEAHRGRLVFRNSRRGVSLASRFPAALLYQLASAGAVQPLGEGRYGLAREGRARLARGPGRDFSAQHREVALVPEPAGGGGIVAVNLREDPLALLRRHRPVAHLVGPAEIEAGIRFRKDMHLAGAVPSVTMNWSRELVDGGGMAGLPMTEQVVAARQRVNRAMAAVGPDFAGILVDVCGFGKGLETLEREQSLPARAGKVALAYALRDLARHYGLSNTATGLERGRLQAWMQEG